MSAIARVLGIETSSALSSVALIDGDLVREAELVDGRRHAEVLAPLLREVTEGAPRPELIACGVGPGPYTGLRVGISTALALGLAWEVPVVGICSLDALAAQVDFAQMNSESEVLVHADARRKEWYWAAYNAQGVRSAGPHVHRPGELPEAVSALSRAGEPELAPHARIIASIARDLVNAGEPVATPVTHLSAHGLDTGETAQALGSARLLAPYPLYLRRPDAVAPAGGAA